MFVFEGHKEQVVFQWLWVEKAEEIHKKSDLGQVMKELGSHVKNAIRI